MTLRRVVVTGMGAVTPIGNTLNAYWDSLIKGVSGAVPITRFDATNFKTKFACEVKGFDPMDFMDRKEARKMDLYSQFAMVSAIQAIEDSKLDLESIDLDKAGVIYASGIGGLSTLENELTEFVNGTGVPRFNPFLVPKMIADIAAGLISIKFGLRGPNYATVSACASSSHAISNAFDCIRLGRADIMVTGGAEAAITVTGIGGFNALRALSTSNDNAQTASRPYDNTRNGFVLGEGAGSLILEEYEHAVKRGATIYAEVAGTGMTGDAYHITAPHPEGLGAAKVMNRAMSDAGMQPTDIDYVNTHGTSTPLGDIAEVKAIERVFGEHAYKMNISSTKSMTGHLLGAAGAIESIASILALKHQIVPPTINHIEKDPEIDERLNFTFNKAQERTINAVLNNTFGFGGHNSSVIFKKV